MFSHIITFCDFSFTLICVYIIVTMEGGVEFWQSKCPRKEKVFGQRREVLCETPFDRLSLDVFKLLAIVSFAFLVAWVLTTS